MTVAPSKSDGGKTLCLKCFYVKRGSFKAIKTPEFLKLKRKIRSSRISILAVERVCASSVVLGSY
jgi:hypothetical protein